MENDSLWLGVGRWSFPQVSNLQGAMPKLVSGRAHKKWQKLLPVVTSTHKSGSTSEGPSGPTINFLKQIRECQIQYVHTVDGWNPANQLRLVVYPSIYRVYTSQVVQDFFHQQYFILKDHFEAGTMLFITFLREIHHKIIWKPAVIFPCCHWCRQKARPTTTVYQDIFGPTSQNIHKLKWLFSSWIIPKLYLGNG